MGANLIICHEALFWNHGDHTDWLQKTNNSAYLARIELLKDAGVTVWRNHDHIHSKIPYGGRYVDGIYYGFAKELGWETYIKGLPEFPMTFDIPQHSAREIIHLFMERLNYDGLKVIGSLENDNVRRVYIAPHIIPGSVGDDLIRKIQRDQIDLIIGQECVDFTVTEYVRDCGELGINKTMIIPGHFNTEEPGMKFFAEYYHSCINPEIPCSFVKAGDMYHYFIA